MGFTRRQTTKEVSSSPRLLDGKSDGSVENPVPWDVPAPAPVRPHFLAPEMKFLTDVKTAGKYMYCQLLMLLRDYNEHGFHPGMITRAEELFEGHPDLLLTFNTYLAKEFQ